MGKKIYHKIGPLPFSVEALQDLILTGLTYKGDGVFCSFPFAVDYKEIGIECKKHGLLVAVLDKAPEEDPPTGFMAKMMLYTGALKRVL